MLSSLALAGSISFSQILTFSRRFILIKKGGMVMFLAQAHKEDSRRVEKLKGVGSKVFSKDLNELRHGSEVSSQI